VLLKPYEKADGKISPVKKYFFFVMSADQVFERTRKKRNKRRRKGYRWTGRGLFKTARPFKNRNLFKKTFMSPLTT